MVRCGARLAVQSKDKENLIKIAYDQGNSDMLALFMKHLISTSSSEKTLLYHAIQKHHMIYNEATHGE